MRNLILTAAALLATTPAQAGDLTLDRLFKSPSLGGAAPRMPKLSPDGRLATLLRNRQDDKDRYDLWAYDTSTGEARMLVDSAKIGSGAEVSEAEKMRRERARIAGTKGITSYEWAPDGHSILVPIDGDLYLADLAGTVRRLTDSSETEIDAKVSATGRFLSFTRSQNLYVIDLANGAERPLTKDGGGTLSWGASEFIAQEELGRNTGYWWSPDDKYLAVARVDESKVKLVTRTAIGAEGTKTFQQRYPAAGTPNAAVNLFVMAPDGSGRVKVDLGKNPDFYLARVDWSADGRSLLVQRLSRDQKWLDLLRVDPTNGRAEILFSEQSRAWVNLNDNLKPLKDGSLIWSSERTGYSHLFRWKAGQWTQLTKGDWAVETVVAVDEKAGRLYFTGTAETPLEQHLYWVPIDKPAKPVRLTEQGWWNNAAMDKGASRALIFRSNPSQPEQVYLADTKGRQLAWIEENKLDATHPYGPNLDSHVAPVFGTIKAKDGSDLHYRLLSPKREPGRRYPVFVDVYAGPHGQKVMRNWSKDMPRHQYLVDRGWIVMTLDGRGTNRRGTAFESQIQNALGGVEVEDQLTGVEWLKTQDYVDAGKVAVMGWSYGGFMVLKLLEAAPGVFAAGAAVAPVTDWAYYDTAYTERYIGNPAIDPAPYRKSGALDDAPKISEPLLLLHGLSDDNVVFDNMTALIAKLQEAQRPFEMMVYPGAAHMIAGEGPQTHLWGTIENFLDRTVKAKD